MSDRFGARLVVALAVGVASLAGCSRSHPTTPPPTTSGPRPIAHDDAADTLDDGALRARLGPGRYAIRPGDHAPVRGATHALVRIVVFQDFAAPEARALAQVYGAALQRWPDAVQVVLVQAPAGTRPMARPLAELTISAGAQGKFWQAHDLVLREPPADRQTLVAAATSLGLDVEGCAHRWTTVVIADGSTSTSTPRGRTASRADRPRS
jgi:protein-disulfide isomerase